MTALVLVPREPAGSATDPASSAGKAYLAPATDFAKSAVRTTGNLAHRGFTANVLELLPAVMKELAVG